MMKGGYEGPKDWAERHAARLQPLVGTLDGGNGAASHRITAILAAPYGHSKRRWCVVTRWRYHDKPELGEFGNTALFLPYD